MKEQEKLPEADLTLEERMAQVPSGFKASERLKWIEVEYLPPVTDHEGGPISDTEYLEVFSPSLPELEIKKKICDKRGLSLEHAESIQIIKVQQIDEMVVKQRLTIYRL